MQFNLLTPGGRHSCKSLGIFAPFFREKGIMKQHACEHYGKQDGYEVWYKTPKQYSLKYRWFASIGEAEVWANRNRGKVCPTSGSWQVLHLFDQ